MMPSMLHLVVQAGTLTPRYQPIVSADLSADIFAIECLTRGPKGTLFESPNVLFDYVRRKRAEVPVEHECVRVALGGLKGIPFSEYITLNVHASTLSRDPEFPRALATRAAMNGVALERLIVEIVEHSPAWNQPKFLQAITSLRERGVGIALDDVGCGNSNYRMILDVNPDFFKIDGHICHGAYADHSRAAVVRSIVHLARDLGAGVIAEGIETEEDVAAMQSFGVDYLQGYFYSKPLHQQQLVELLARKARLPISESVSNTPGPIILP